MEIGKLLIQIPCLFKSECSFQFANPVVDLLQPFTQLPFLDVANQCRCFVFGSVQTKFEALNAATLGISARDLFPGSLAIIGRRQSFSLKHEKGIVNGIES